MGFASQTGKVGNRIRRWKANRVHVENVQHIIISISRLINGNEIGVRLFWIYYAAGPIVRSHQLCASYWRRISLFLQPRQKGAMLRLGRTLDVSASVGRAGSYSLNGILFFVRKDNHFKWC